MLSGYVRTRRVASLPQSWMQSVHKGNLFFRKRIFISTILQSVTKDRWRRILLILLYVSVDIVRSVIELRSGSEVHCWPAIWMIEYRPLNDSSIGTSYRASLPTSAIGGGVQPLCSFF